MTTATLKAKILVELEQLPEEALANIWAYIEAHHRSVEKVEESAFLQVYQRSEQTRAEVYRRLADS